MVKDGTPRGSLRRGLRVGKLGLGLIGSYLGYQVQNVLLGKAAREERRRDLGRRVSRQIREELEQLKGPFMKIGQILSMQTQALPKEAIEELAHLQMRAPGMHPTLARAQFHASLEKYPEDVYREYDPEPFAAASLGQVHRAVTRNGTKVAVKIQYPAIRTAIENDFQVLRSVTLPGRLTGHIPVSILEEVKGGFLEETDYMKEGKSLDLFREGLRSLRYLTIPRVHWDLTTDRVLTMSFVEGVTIGDFLARKPSQELRDLVGRRLLEMFLIQLHTLHMLHADPHPGNYLFSKRGEIGLVDFGCVTRFSPKLSKISRMLIDGLWKEGEEHEITLLLWGRPEYSRSKRLGRMLRGVTDYYERLYPPVGTIVDFGDAALLEAIARNFRGAVQNRLANPEFAFAGRAELGLLNLLHRLGARFDAREVWEAVKARSERRG